VQFIVWFLIALVVGHFLVGHASAEDIEVIEGVGFLLALVIGVPLAIWFFMELARIKEKGRPTVGGVGRRSPQAKPDDENLVL
jgi:hypothetical protein